MVAVQIALLAGEDHFDLSPRRHGDGDIQNFGRLLDLSGAEFLPHRWRAAVQWLHVFLHRQLHLSTRTSGPEKGEAD